ncbi:hypothetical protein GGR55DRAFT_150277 [Xylaria sp. FL0064]|nr:hypothetical protein GGR55DRAFT_150277 [Xylaria sp. FL0064]
MSFGVSVGDFVAVGKLASKLRRTFIDAPTQFRAISDEVRTLTHLLQDLEDAFPERDISQSMRDTLGAHLTACGTLLKDIDSKLGKYYGLQPAGARMQRLWHRLRWEPDEIRDLRARLTYNIVLLSGMNEFINRFVVGIVPRV